MTSVGTTDSCMAGLCEPISCGWRLTAFSWLVPLSNMNPRPPHKQGPDCCNRETIWCTQKLQQEAHLRQPACVTQGGRRHWQTMRAQHATSL